MNVQAVVFDWAGTMTPWHDVDVLGCWRSTARVIDAATADDLAAALLAAEHALAKQRLTGYSSMTLEQVFAHAGVPFATAAVEAYIEAWQPHTITDPAVSPVLKELRRRGIKVGVLSNTTWSRRQIEAVFDRDGVLDLIDAAVFTSEIPWNKPHPEAFGAILRALGPVEPRHAVYVGDRLFDDVHGAKSAGMRAVFIPLSTISAGESQATDAVPDATIERLADLVPVIDDWNS